MTEFGQYNPENPVHASMPPRLRTVEQFLAENPTGIPEREDRVTVAENNSFIDDHEKLPVSEPFKPLTAEKFNILFNEAKPKKRDVEAKADVKKLCTSNNSKKLALEKAPEPKKVNPRKIEERKKSDPFFDGLKLLQDDLEAPIKAERARRAKGAGKSFGALALGAALLTTAYLAQSELLKSFKEQRAARTEQPATTFPKIPVPISVGTTRPTIEGTTTSSIEEKPTTIPTPPDTIALKTKNMDLSSINETEISPEMLDLLRMSQGKLTRNLKDGYEMSGNISYECSGAFIRDIYTDKVYFATADHCIGGTFEYEGKEYAAYNTEGEYLMNYIVQTRDGVKVPLGKQTFYPDSQTGRHRKAKVTNVDATIIEVLDPTVVPAAIPFDKKAPNDLKKGDVIAGQSIFRKDEVGDAPDIFIHFNEENSILRSLDPVDNPRDNAPGTSGTIDINTRTGQIYGIHSGGNTEPLNEEWLSYYHIKGANGRQVSTSYDVSASVLSDLLKSAQ